MKISEDRKNSPFCIKNECGADLRNIVSYEIADLLHRNKVSIRPRDKYPFAWLNDHTIIEDDSAFCNSSYAEGRMPEFRDAPSLEDVKMSLLDNYNIFFEVTFGKFYFHVSVLDLGKGEEIFCTKRNFHSYSQALSFGIFKTLQAWK